MVMRRKQTLKPQSLCAIADIGYNKVVEQGHTFTLITLSIQMISRYALLCLKKKKKHILGHHRKATF